MKIFIIGFLIKMIIVDLPREWGIYQDNKRLKNHNRQIRKTAKRLNELGRGNAGLNIKDKFP